MGKVIPRGYHLSHLVFVAYKFIALPPRTPSMADATAIITFRTVLQPDFFISSTPPFYVILIYAVGSSTMSPSPPFSDSLPSSAALISMNSILSPARVDVRFGRTLDDGRKFIFTAIMFLAVHFFFRIHPFGACRKAEYSKIPDID